jgi:SAM-dependent methyltransferase
MEFEVPEHLNRNAVTVRALGTPAFTGRILLDYMAGRLGWPDLAGKTVLDVGCGTRFTSAILSYQIPIGRYIGIDVNSVLVEWLKENAVSPLLEFHYIDQANPMYNPTGTVHEPDWGFASAADVCCMFSVITHQLPPAATGLFHEAHRRVRDDGFLFFSAALREDGLDYIELGENATDLSSYREDFLRQLLSDAGWRIVSKGPPDPAVPGCPIPFVPIASHFVCRKA